MTNNILVGDATDGGEGTLRSAAPTPAPQSWHAAANFSRNIVYSRSGLEIFQHTPGEPSPLVDWAQSTFEDNVYWRAGGGGVLFPGNESFATWQRVGAGTVHGGQDAGSRVADPLFKDPNNNDFSLQPGSPALALGFQPIDLSTVGPRADSARLGV